MVEVESRIEQVTVYARGARVRRIARLPAPVPTAVRFVGLPLAVIEDTVRVEVDGPAVVTTVRAGVDAPDPKTAAAEDTAELRAARRRVALAEAELERLGQAIERQASAPIVEDDPSDDPPAAWAPVVAARRALVAVRTDRELALHDRLAAARRELDDARRALEVAAERDRKTGSARAAKLHELRRHVELEVVARAPGEVTIRLEYLVGAARWAPSYVARLDAETARFELRAVVAQHSGEDWTGVALRLSTAEPDRFSQLPELAAQKIGRRQQEPARRGFRPPPTGADQLYADYDRGFPPSVVSSSFASVVFDDSTYEGRAPTAPPDLEISEEVWDEDSKDARAIPSKRGSAPLRRERSKAAPTGMAFGGIAPPAAPQSITVAPAPAAPRGLMRQDLAGKLESASVPSPPPSPRLDYGNLRMAGASAHRRGMLVAAPRALDEESAARVAEAIASVERLALPPGCVVEWTHAYDYAFATDGKVDVRSDATWCSIAVTAKSGAAKLRHVAVPREQADVFRVAAIANPLEGPLLPGPIDVYDRGQFLVTSDVEYTPPGGTVDVGLGVDPAVKVARNVEFHEEAVGMLRGGLRLVHAVAVAVENLSPRAIDLEVRERVPVIRDDEDDVEIAVGKVDPPWERWTPDPDGPRDARLRGGYCWRFSLAPSTKQLLRASYEVKLAGKLELVGGNRREP